MTAARLLIAVVGILLPYAVRVPRGAAWVAQYTDIGIGGLLFFGAFNAIAWGSLVGLTFLVRRPVMLLIPCALGFGCLAWSHATLDLAADAQAALGLVFIPIVALVPIAIGGVVALALERRAPGAGPPGRRVPPSGAAPAPGPGVGSDRPVPTPSVTLAPVTEPDWAVLRDLAGTIWRQHYAGIVSAAQIDFMLGGRFNDEALRGHMHAADRWLDLLRVDGAPVGYCGYELAGPDGGGGAPAAMKLGQLYVLRSHRGTGLGRFMLGHVERRARDCGCRSLWLQVNRRNTGAIAFYRAAGFGVVREAVFEIGGGFVMDDYVMAKEV